MGFRWMAQTAASVPTPPAGKLWMFLDSADGAMKTKDSAGAVAALAGSSASSSGSSGQVQFGDGAGGFIASAGLTFDSTNKALTIGGATVTASVAVINSSLIWNNAAVTFGAPFTQNITATAAANNSRTFDWKVNSASYFHHVYDTSGGYFQFGATSPHGQTFKIYPRGGSGCLFDIGGSLTMGTADTDSVQLYGKTLMRFNGYTPASAAGLDFNINAGDGYGAYTGGGGQLRMRAGNANNGNNDGGNYYLDSGAKSGTGKDGNIIVGYTRGKLILNPCAVAQLPTAAAALSGGVGFVTDASTTLALGLGTTVTGGGANKSPVHCDGTNWIYG